MWKIVLQKSTGCMFFLRIDIRPHSCYLTIDNPQVTDGWYSDLPSSLPPSLAACLYLMPSGCLGHTVLSTDDVVSQTRSTEAIFGSCLPIKICLMELQNPDECPSWPIFTSNNPLSLDYVHITSNAFHFNLNFVYWLPAISIFPYAQWASSAVGNDNCPISLPLFNLLCTGPTAV